MNASLSMSPSADNIAWAAASDCPTTFGTMMAVPPAVEEAVVSGAENVAADDGAGGRGDVDLLDLGMITVGCGRG
jgi:hypothetical protein